MRTFFHHRRYKPVPFFRCFVHVLLLLGLSSLISGCVTVQPGYRGIRVFLSDEKNKAGDIEVLGVGRYLVLSFSKRVFTFPVFQQNYVWSKANPDGDKSISFQTSEGLSVNGDFGISYSIIPDSVATIFQRYRRGIEEITDIFLRNMVRDALNTEASQLTAEEIYSRRRQELLRKVESAVAAQVKPYGIIIDRIYTVGEFRLPDKVVQAINSKIEATQRAQQRENELRLAEAEVQIAVARQRGKSESELIEAKTRAEIEVIRAKAEAEANLLRAKALSPLLIQLEAILKWNGVLPLVTGAESPILDLKEMFKFAPFKESPKESKPPLDPTRK